MQTVTVSLKYQVVIPKSIREKLEITPGQKIQAILFNDRIEMIPIQPIKKMRGYLKGIDTNIEREDERL
ncbi:AbrB/MazE/SpoVT family DNA-binding domain-containing protein [bacterium]|nr:AbrB/MazE/SpoVT family DNA-binding domain-containing protein [bacterium]